MVGIMKWDIVIMANLLMVGGVVLLGSGVYAMVQAFDTLDVMTFVAGLSGVLGGGMFLFIYIIWIAT